MRNEADPGVTDDGDFARMDLKADFELPESLPPVSLPAPDELADAARAAEVVGADADDETALHAWCDELYELLSGTRYLLPDDLDAAAEVAADEYELSFTGTGAIVAVMLFLGGSGVDAGELRVTIEETVCADPELTDAERQWNAWVRDYGDPVTNLLQRLEGIGAAVFGGVEDAAEEGMETVRLSPLGRYGVRERLIESGVSVPALPPPERMNALELLTAVEGADEDEAADLATDWIATQGATEATRQLLDAAAGGEPAQRVLATALADEIEPAQPECWQEALNSDSVRPYAKVALARMREDLPEEGEELEPSWQDLGWLLADTVAPAVDTLDEDELAEEIGEMELPEGDPAELFAGVWRGGHPYAQEVLDAIGRHHPDPATAKAARKAAYRAGSTTR